jgi:membrane protein
MDLAGLLGRFLGRPGVIEARAVFDVYGRAPGALLANGLAFAALFTTIPLALVTLGVAGWLIGDPALQAQVAAAIGRLVPPLAGFVDQALVAVSEGAALTSLVGVAGLAWTLSQFYATLDIAFSRIFTDDPARGLVGRTARGFAVVAGLIAVVVALIVAGSLAAAAEAFLPASTSALTAVGEILSSFPVVAAVGVVAVMVVYRFVPATQPRGRAIVLPSIVVGVVIVASSQLFLFLAPRLVSVEAVAGSLATAFVALAWLSVTFQALLLGAAWVRVRDADRGGMGGSALSGAAAPAEPGAGGE